MSTNYKYKANNRLEKRLLYVLIIITIFSSMGWTLYRVYNFIGWTVVAMHVLSATLMACLFFFYTKRGKFELVALLYFSFHLIMLPYGFFVSGGLSGGAVYYLVIFFVCGLLILPPQYFFIFAFTVLLIFCNISIIEYISPDLVIYPSSNNLLISKAISFNFLLIILGVFLYYFKREYVNEEEKKAILNNRLIKEKEKVEQSEKNKTTILTAIWQELNDPAQNINQVLQNFNKEHLDNDQKSSLSQITNNSEFLTSIISDLVDTFSNNLGNTPLRQIKFNLHDEISNLLFMMEGSKQSKDSIFQLDYSKEVPSQVIGDPIRIKQAIRSLISNILKKAPPSEINISTRLFYCEDKKCTIRINLECTNTGLSQLAQENTFSKLYFADEDWENDDSAIDLQLYMSKSLIEKLNSSIQFSSVKDFHFNLYFDVLLEHVP